MRLPRAIPFVLLLALKTAAALGSPSSLPGQADAGFIGPILGGPVDLTRDNRLFSAHSFDTKGEGHPSSLARTGDGAFYGTTIDGGASDAGTIFRITEAGLPIVISTDDIPPSGTWLAGFEHQFTVLHSFDGDLGGGRPAGPLVVATDGFIYGLTEYGGEHNLGTVFRMSADGSFTVLHSFTAEEGALPAHLIQASDGNFYGTTLLAPAERGFKIEGSFETTIDDHGVPIPLATAPTLFKVTAAGKFSRLGTIAESSLGYPFAPPLVESSDGNLFVATVTVTTAGLFYPHHTLKKFSKTGGLLGTFPFATDYEARGNGWSFRGSLPDPPMLLFGSDGDLYVSARGQIYRFTNDGESRVVAALPLSGSITSLTQAADGRLVGTARAGFDFTIPPGAPSWAEYIFRVNHDGKLVFLHRFADSGEASSLLEGKDGAFYGVTGRTVNANERGRVFVFFSPRASTENNAPLTRDDHAGSGMPVLGANFDRANVLANDRDPDGEFLTITSVSDFAVTINSDQTLSYTAPNYLVYHPPLESFTYTVSDPHGNTATAAVRLENNAPVAVDDVTRPSIFSDRWTGMITYSGNFLVLQNDSDPDGDSLTVTAVSVAGRTPVDPDPRVTLLNGQVLYEEKLPPGATPLQSFTYTVSDGKGASSTATVYLANRAPIARDDLFTDDSPDTGPGSIPTRILRAHVLANDSDPDGDALTVISATSSTGDVVTVTPEGTVTVEQAEVFSSVSVTYTISDGRGGTASATVREQSNPSIPIARDDKVRLNDFDPIQISVLANDVAPGGGPLRVVATSQARFGAVGLTPGEPHVSYTPGDFFPGKDSFTYSVADLYGNTAFATVRITGPRRGFRGAFHGLIGAPERFGEIRINLNAGGNFTGKLLFGGMVYPLRGVFAGASAALNLQRAGHSPLRLTLERIPASDGQDPAITGTLEDDRFSVEFRLDRSARTNSAQRTGAYTIAFPATPFVGKGGSAVKPDPFAFPQAPGFALMNVTEHGSALIVGELGDGRRFSAGARLAHDGTLPLFVPCYSGGWKTRGLSGTIRFADLSDSDCKGELSWHRPAQSRGSYPAGFVGKVSLTGSRFIAEAGLLMREVEIALTAGPREILRKRATLTANGTFAITPAGSDQLELFVNTSNGLLAGRFKHPATNQMTSIAGVVLQKPSSARGLFRNDSQTGALSIRSR